jgi:phosphoribosylglycinamide formyltransferase-1
MENKTSTIERQTPNTRLAIFASGTGTNAQKLIDYFRDSATARVALIVCNKRGAGVLGIAEREGIPALLIEKEPFFHGDAYLPQLKEKGIDFIVLAGFLWKIPQALIDAFPRRIVNIHPALLPRFGGKGMYGQYVHEAVLQAGEVETGITIHYVDEHYDSGDVIFQTACPILEGDTPESIANRIHQLEHLHYPRVVEEIIKSPFPPEGET